MTRSKNIVTRIEDDGDFIEARFVRANGEVMIGKYKRFGWTDPPLEVHNDITERMMRPVEAMTWPKRP